MKRMRKFLLIFLIIFSFLVIFQSKLHRLKSKTNIPEPVKRELINLAAQSLDRLDVPVGSILLYENKTIGKGFNTVLGDSITSGHAEINALNEAIKKIGYQRFMALDRSKLVLYSTLEPCEMCTGTLQHYNIRNVVYMKEKPLIHWWRQHIKSLYYQIRKQKAEGGEIQDSLFQLHPQYPNH